MDVMSFICGVSVTLIVEFAALVAMVCKRRKK
jgi:hypothetical protein